jgi:hypothetical protein
MEISLLLLVATLLGFLVGARTSKKQAGVSAVWPITHVSFERSLSDTDRLKFLDEVRTAVGDGRLSQSNQLENYGSSNKAAKPGACLED